FLGVLETTALADLTIPDIKAVRTAVAKGTHPKLTRRKASPTTANKIVKQIKTVWEHATLTFKNVPQPPAEYRHKKKLFVKHEPERPFMPAEMFPAYWKATTAMSQLMRNYWRGLLLTGARRRTLGSAKIADYDRTNRRLHFWRDKNGPYTIPLSDAM